MTASTTKIERSAPAVRAVLAQVSPDECAQFEVEFAEGLARASAEFDLAPAESVLDRWWGIAAIRANPLSEHEAAHVGGSAVWRLHGAAGPGGEQVASAAPVGGS